MGIEIRWYDPLIPVVVIVAVVIGAEHAAIWLAHHIHFSIT